MAVARRQSGALVMSISVPTDTCSFRKDGLLIAFDFDIRDFFEIL